MDNRVFHVMHVLTRLPVGGVENMLLKVVEHYDKKQFRVSICCIQQGGEVADTLKDLGYEVHILHRMQGRGFDWGAVRALYQCMKRDRVDILRTHQYHANLYGRIAGIMARVPVMVPSFHNLYHSPGRPKLHRRIINYLLGFASDSLIAVSQAVAADIVRYDRIDPERIRVIYNGIVTQSYDVAVSKSEARKAMNLPEQAFIIGNVGRLSEQKGQQYLVDAARGMKDIVIAIAGGGELGTRLRQEAEKAGVRCILTGMLRPEEIPLFLKSLDLFCFPSLWEGLGSALIEAMAAGLPIIASDLPPLREVLGEAGLLVRPGDPGAIRGAVDALIAGPSVREGYARAAKERAALFSMERTIRTYEDLFESLLRAKGLA